MTTFKNASGYVRNTTLNASIAAPTSNVMFAYLVLLFAVILCKYNMYTSIVLGSVTFEGITGKNISKVLLMILFAEGGALAAKIVSQLGKYMVYLIKAVGVSEKKRFFHMYRKTPQINSPFFKSLHITHAFLHFIMTPKSWVHVFRLNTRRNNIERQLI